MFPMPIKEAIEVLEQFNEWRKYDSTNIEMPPPHDITRAIDVAIDILKNTDTR